MTDHGAQLDQLLASGEARRVVHRAVQKMIGPNDLDDVTQDVLLIAWQQVRTFRGDSALSTWLHRVAWNYAAKWLLRRGRRPPADDVRVEDGAEPPELVDDAGPETLAARDEMAEHLARELRALGPERSAVLQMQLDGVPYEVIEAMTGVKAVTLRSGVHRIRARMRAASDA